MKTKKIINIILIIFVTILLYNFGNMEEDIELDIDKKLKLYYESNEECKKIIESMDDYHIRLKIGYVVKHYNEHQREEIITTFRNAVKIRKELQRDINKYYVNKITQTPESVEKIILIAQYRKFQKIKFKKSVIWASPLTSCYTIEESTTKTRRLSKFTKLLNMMKIHCGGCI